MTTASLPDDTSWLQLSFLLQHFFWKTLWE